MNSQASSALQGLTVTHSFSRKSPNGPINDAPDLAENPLNLFTLPYSQLLDALADTIYPPIEVSSQSGTKRVMQASGARIDRHVHFRAAWQPAFGARIQLALRDLSTACMSRYGGRHFVLLSESEREEVVAKVQQSGLPATEWNSLRPQADAFVTIHDAISCGLMADPGYGGNLGGLGWFYTSFMTLAE